MIFSTLADVFLYEIGTETTFSGRFRLGHVHPALEIPIFGPIFAGGFGQILSTWQSK